MKLEQIVKANCFSCEPVRGKMECNGEYYSTVGDGVCIYKEAALKDLKNYSEGLLVNSPVMLREYLSKEPWYQVVLKNEQYKGVDE